jgi:FlaG protein
MSEGSVGPIGDVGAVRGSELAAVEPVVRYGRRRGDDPRLPGVLQFDQVEVNTPTGVSQSYAKFIVHPDSGIVSIKIIDARTDTVIREIPPEDVLKIVEELQSYLKLRTAKRG